MVSTSQREKTRTPLRSEIVRLAALRGMSTCSAYSDVRLADELPLQLIATYMCMSPAPHAMHSVVGYGIRLAKDLGVHRRATYGPNPTVEDDLKRRAFW